jgi:hypothetical protein
MLTLSGEAPQMTRMSGKTKNMNDWVDFGHDVNPLIEYSTG